MHTVLEAPRAGRARTVVGRPDHVDRMLAMRPAMLAELPAGGVLQLQRSIGNRAVVSLLRGDSARDVMVQRHPEHAEEQEVQRHPEHAEEQEVQPTMAVQTWPFKKKTADVSPAILKEQAMTAKYGVQIGPAGGAAAGGHLSLKILKKIEKVLDQIPPEHLRGASLAGGISSGAGLGAASAYDPNTHQIEMVVPSGVPDWLYPVLNKSSGWQRWLMDVGAKAGYEGVGGGGVLNARRQVMGGGKRGKRLGGNLLEWTVRHEMGHAVDEQVKWTQHRAKLDECGGWQQHETDGDMEQGDMAVLDVLLSNAGFTDHMSPRTFLLNGVTMAARLLKNNVLVRATDPTDLATMFGSAQRADQMRAAVPGFDAKWARFLSIRKKALAQPWTLSDGGGNDLQSNGRMYFVDSYNSWTSVLVARRNADSLSRYMFSNPGEWFAEAYAAFYAPKPSTRNQLNASVRALFARDLGAPNTQRDDDRGRPALATGPADQQRLRALTSDTDGLVAALADDTSESADPSGSSPTSETAETSV